MKKGKHPIIFILILFAITLVISGILAGIISIFIKDDDISISGAVARIIVSIFMISLFYNKDNFKYNFRGLKLMLPLLLFGLYKIPLWFYTQGEMSNVLTGFICGLAPGIYEEFLFRGIFMDQLSRKYKSNAKILLLSTIVFSLVHLTNAIGQDLTSVIFQVIFSVAFGIAVGGFYIKTKDICSVIIVHAATDIIGYIFISNPTSSYLALILVAILCVSESLYGILLSKNSANIA